MCFRDSYNSSLRIQASISFDRAIPVTHNNSAINILGVEIIGIVAFLYFTLKDCSVGITSISRNSSLG